MHKLQGQWEEIYFIMFYIDDMLLEGNDPGLLYEIKQMLLKNFHMKEFDEASFVLSIEIH